MIVEHQGFSLPIEVKAGRGRMGKSLNLFLREKRPCVRQAVLVSQEPFRPGKPVMTLPFYALMKIADSKFE